MMRTYVFFHLPYSVFCYFFIPCFCSGQVLPTYSSSHKTHVVIFFTSLHALCSSFYFLVLLRSGLARSIQPTYLSCFRLRFLFFSDFFCSGRVLTHARTACCTAVGLTRDSVKFFVFRSPPLLLSCL